MTLQEIKMNMNRSVIFRGSEYKLVGCIFRQNDKTSEYYYQAELLDLKCGRSVVVCRLEDVFALRTKEENENE